MPTNGRDIFALCFVLEQMRRNLRDFTTAAWRNGRDHLAR